MKLTLRNLGVFLICLLILYNFAILLRRNPGSFKREGFSLYSEETHTLHRPHVEKYAIIMEPGDGRLDELGGPDHWYSHQSHKTITNASMCTSYLMCYVVITTLFVTTFFVAVPIPLLTPNLLLPASPGSSIKSTTST